MVRVALCQIRVDESESVDDRMDRVEAMVRRDARSADLVVLPELWQVGAFDVDRGIEHAEPVGGPFTTRMADLARHLNSTLHAGSFPEAHPDGISNTSVVLQPDGRIQALYRKIHLFGFDRGEAVRSHAGTDPVVTPTPLGSTGLAICYDLRFPELFRLHTEEGAHAWIIPAGWPADRIAHWQTLVRARAIENQGVVLACNAVGSSGGLAMGGHSVVVAADGNVLAEADGRTEQILWAEVDATHPPQWREEFPALKDRRLR